MIGNLGKLITFNVAENSILTFEKLTQEVKGRWTTHAPIGGKPYSEFLGPDNRTISMPVTIRAEYGINPRKTIESIEQAVEKGEHYVLVIGGKRIGSYEWVISSMSQSWNRVLNNGELISASLTLSLTEYR